MFLVEGLFQNEFLKLFFEGYRSSCPEVFCKKGFLRNFAKFTGNTCARVSFLIKLQLQFSTLLKKKLWHRWILRNFKEHIFLQNVSGCCLWRVICQAFLKDWNEYGNIWIAEQHSRFRRYLRMGMEWEWTSWCVGRRRQWPAKTVLFSNIVRYTFRYNILSDLSWFTTLGRCDHRRRAVYMGMEWVWTVVPLWPKYENFPNQSWILHWRQF